MKNVKKVKAVSFATEKNKQLIRFESSRTFSYRHQHRVFLNRDTNEHRDISLSRFLQQSCWKRTKEEEDRVKTKSKRKYFLFDSIRFESKIEIKIHLSICLSFDVRLFRWNGWRILEETRWTIRKYKWSDERASVSCHDPCKSPNRR